MDSTARVSGSFTKATEFACAMTERQYLGLTSVQLNSDLIQ